MHMQTSSRNDCSRLPKFIGLCTVCFVLLGCDENDNTKNTTVPAAWIEARTALEQISATAQWSSGGADGYPNGYMIVLAHSELTDDQLKHLLDLEMFQTVVELYIGHARVTDKGLAHLKEQKGIQRLELDGNEISDDGLKHLSSLSSLKTLSLYKTNITDDGIKHLQALSKLIRLDLRQTHVTEDGVKALREAVPNCNIKL